MRAVESGCGESSFLETHRSRLGNSNIIYDIAVYDGTPPFQDHVEK